MEDYQSKILVVDDEPDILEFISYNLRQAQFEVITANNGEQAIAMAEAHSPDLIILDIMMPDMDGVEVCRVLRSKQQLDHTLIAFLTARNEDYTLIAALDAGGDDFVTKPIRPRVLLSRIKALLRRQGRHQDPKDANGIISFDELVIDPEKVAVFKGGESIDLARKEFELFRLLASKPGKVFTRDEIFRRVWGRDVIVGNRTIDVHIRKLREKVGSEYIKTVKGIGYKFDF